MSQGSGGGDHRSTYASHSDPSGTGRDASSRSLEPWSWPALRKARSRRHSQEEVRELMQKCLRAVVCPTMWFDQLVALTKQHRDSTCSVGPTRLRLSTP